MTTNPESALRIARTVTLVRDMSRLTGSAEIVRHSTRRLELRAPACRVFRVTLDVDEGAQARVHVTESPSLAEGTAAPSEASGAAVESRFLSELVRRGEASLLEDVGWAGDAGWVALARPRSLAAIPVFRSGELAHMLILASTRPRDIDHDLLDELTWQVNLHAQAAVVAQETSDLRRAHAKLDRDLAYISRLQQRILPEVIPSLPGARIEVRMRPSERSGGDFYDFFALPDGRWAVLLADVCGHGTATAVLMSITHAMTRLARPFVRPDAFLAFLDRHLYQRYTAETGAFVAACIVVYDPRTRTITFSLAGLPSPRLVGAGGVVTLDRARGPGLGLLPGSRYASARQSIASGDLLVLFTDGVVEASTPQGELYGEERLDAQILEAARRGEDTAESVEASVSAFASDRPDQDDRTLLTLRFD